MALEDDAAATRARRGAIARGTAARRSRAARMSTPLRRARSRCEALLGSLWQTTLVLKRASSSFLSEVMRPSARWLLLAALLALAGFARADHPTYGDAVRANRGPYPIDEADARARHARSGVGRVTGINNAVGADIGGTGFRRRRLLEEDTATITRAPAPRKGCAAHADEASCRSPCVWCVASAVPSACFNAKNAGRLPPGVFTCKSDTDDHALGADVAATNT